MGTRLDESIQQQLVTLPMQRTSEKGVVQSVDTTTGLVTYLIDDVEHTALVMSGFMPAAGQPVQIAVNGNDRVVMPPAGVDPVMYGQIETSEGPPVNPNTLEDAANIVGWDASFGVTTWQFDATIESWVGTGGGLTLTHDATTGQNEGGGGGVVGSVRGVATRSGLVYCYSPIVTILRDADLASLGSVWVRTGQSGSDTKYADVSIQWFDSTGVTFEKESNGPQVFTNATEWVSLDVSDFGPPNPLSNKARIVVRFFNALVGDVYYVDNGILMAPTNCNVALMDPADTLTDNFNRADNTNMTTGSAFTWTERSGDWAIASNQARLTTHAGGLTSSMNAVTTALPGAYSNRNNIVMQATAASTVSTVNGWGLVWRYSATNNFWRFWSSGTFNSVFLDKVVAGVSTNMAILTSTVIEPGDTVRVETDGGWHRVFLNNALIFAAYDTALQSNTEHGLLSENVTTNRWEIPPLAPGDAAYVRPGRTTSLEMTSIAAGTTFARTPADTDMAALPAVRQGEYWIMDGWIKQRRANTTGSTPVLYLYVLTVYDANGTFLANDFGGGFGPSGSFAWTRMISAFEIKNPLAARIKANVVFLAGAASQRFYVSEIFLRRASVVTAPILRTGKEGPRLETLPTPTGPQIRVFKEATNDGGYSQMLHGAVYPGGFSGTTDASGYITFSHGLRNGQLPAGVFVQPRSPISGASIFSQAIVDSVQTDGTARVRCINHLGAAMASTAVTFFYFTLART